MRKPIDWEVNINGEDLNNLKFADDIVLISNRIDTATQMLKRFQQTSNSAEFQIHISIIQNSTNLYLWYELHID